MNNEIKIGMYTTDEILEFMTNGEGRGFMGRSMYDAILDYITNLQEENKRLNNIIKEAINYIDDNTYYKDHKGHINIDDVYIILQGSGSNSND